MSVEAVRSEKKELKDLERMVAFCPIVHTSITSLPIIEGGEELVDVLQEQNTRLIKMMEFSKQYDPGYNECTLVRATVYKRLLNMLDYLPEHLGIAFFEGYRPLKVQKKYFDHRFISQLEKYKDPEIAYSETCKFVSPFIENIPTHSTGAAIDITLFDVKEHRLLDLGDFDAVPNDSNLHETFSSAASQEQRKNRVTLLKAAIEAGFANYGYEWWHFSYGDKMHAMVRGLSHAIYGLADSSDTEMLTLTKEEYFKSFLEIH